MSELPERPLVRRVDARTIAQPVHATKSERHTERPPQVRGATREIERGWPGFDLIDATSTAVGLGGAPGVDARELVESAAATPAEHAPGADSACGPAISSACELAHAGALPVESTRSDIGIETCAYWVRSSSS